MARCRVLVLRTSGTNCDEETAFAFRQAGASPEKVHLNRFTEGSRRLGEFDILAVPGGFSYGDDVAAGKVQAVELAARLGEDLRAFVEAGKLVLGICNGFQVLVKMGLLPGSGAGEATLTHNDSQRFEDRWVELLVSAGPCVFTKGMGGSVVRLPVAHGEGKFVMRHRESAQRLVKEGQAVFRYGKEGRPAGENDYPANPNGSVLSIAGVCDPTGRVLGLMPHPERHVRGIQAPDWTRRSLLEEGEGLALFRNAVAYGRG